MTLTNFVCNLINYLQKKCCAMGTKYVPSSTNVFMGWFEERFIFPLLTNLSNVCLHFIDSISLIWNETKTEFVILASNVNLKCLKQKSIFSTPQCLMYIANWEQKCMSTNQKTVIYTANWNILIPLREVFSIARHWGSIKFATIEAICVTAVNFYLKVH